MAEESSSSETERQIGPPPPQPPGLTRYGSALSSLIGTVVDAVIGAEGEFGANLRSSSLLSGGHGHSHSHYFSRNPPPPANHHHETPRRSLTNQTRLQPRETVYEHKLKKETTFDIADGHLCRPSQARRGRWSLRNFRAPFICRCRNLGEALRRVREGAAMSEEGGRSRAVDEHQMANRETKYSLPWICCTVNQVWFIVQRFKGALELNPISKRFELSLNSKI
ncbi:hypothetical protein TIFTF001_021986 [Ficus carica]|uniref:PdxS/SNZ N-terminal domain-containing protein n=1 Tax=Ficus carica TaxID=3494 RepID=A0AA88AZ84_FICCA|nr:hypothetical protein TIFTF001_021986 [Ficus carica]